ncbi:MAG: hypothetical protein J6Z14_08370 [Prevotella sp.]|nr:hypothetical protein [Prevotella sp.]
MILITGKEGIVHRTGKEIQNVFQNLFKQRGKWRREVRENLAQYYTADAPRATNERPIVVAMIDGKLKHGGLADRLRGIISAYYVSRMYNRDFRIFFVHPFPLIDYLVPNLHDWRISEADLCFNNNDAEAMFCGSNATHVERWFQEQWFKKRIKGMKRQLHIYTNAWLTRSGNTFQQCFNELFRPSEALETALDKAMQPLAGKEYFAVTLRFQQLLGDFKEDNYDVLPEAERKLLMDRCVEQIAHIHTKMKVKKRILVTSDSSTFIDYAASQLDYVYVVPGKLTHIDWATDIPFEMNLKSFVDLLMISRAQKAFLLQTGKMYNSGFPRRAAQIGNVPFQHIRF